VTSHDENAKRLFPEARKPKHDRPEPKLKHRAVLTADAAAISMRLRDFK
jgi:hypothetical protein